MISAQTARDISKGISDDSKLLQGLEDHIRYCAGNGDRNCRFYTGGEHFSDEELDLIRDSGYEILWNSPCLWYEVYW